MTGPKPTAEDPPYEPCHYEWQELIESPSLIDPGRLNRAINHACYLPVGHRDDHACGACEWSIPLARIAALERKLSEAAALPPEHYDRMVEILEEIRDKKGPYKVDNHEHAISVIESNSEGATEILDFLAREKEAP